MELISANKSTDPRRAPIEGKILVAHQAEFFPWLGFISKATMCDLYFILDDSQYKKKYFENRNKIRINNEEGWIWLSAPVTADQSFPNLQDVHFVDIQRFKIKSLKTIETSYRKTHNFEEYYEELKSIFEAFNSDRLADFNITIIKHAFKKFKVNIPIYTTSWLNKNGYQIEGHRTELVIQMCKAAGANVYIQGQGGKEYHDLERFKEEGIKLVFQKFTHPVYIQTHGSFIPYMSFVDLLFNYKEEEAIRILDRSDVEY